MRFTGVAGFEPTHEGVKVPCLTAWLYPKTTKTILSYICHSVNTFSEFFSKNYFMSFSTEISRLQQEILTVLTCQNMVKSREKEQSTTTLLLFRQ